MADDEPWGSAAERLEKEQNAGRSRLKYHNDSAEAAKALGNLVDAEAMSQIAAMNAREEARVAEELQRQDAIAKTLKMGDPNVVIDGKNDGWPMPTMVNPEAAQEAYERAVKEQQAVGPGVHKQDAVLVPPATPRTRIKSQSVLDDMLDKKK